MPVSHDVLRHAGSAPDRVALGLGRPDAVGWSEEITYAELARCVVSAAALLGQGGAGVSGGPVTPGSIVAILPPPLPPTSGLQRPAGTGWAQTLVVLLAADLVGATPLVCEASWNDAHREDVLSGVRPEHRVTVSLCAPRDSTHSDLLSSGATRGAPLRPSSCRTPRPEDLAWAGFTSGSTSRPRAVVRTRASWTESFAAVTDLSGTTAASTVLVPGDLATSLYCFATMHALSAGATVRPVTTPQSIGPSALVCDVLHVTPAQLALVLDTLDASGAPGAPSTHDDIAAAEPARTRARTALVGGASLSSDLRRRAGRAGVRVVSYYGAAELSFVAVDPDGTGLRPFPGVEIEVRTDGHAPYGAVWVRSPWLASGYLAGVTGPLRRSGGWASVGDLAEPRTLDGPLTLRGRGTGAIMVGAATVLPEDVEAVLATDPCVTEVVVLGTPHARWGQVVTAVLVLAQSGDPTHGESDLHEEPLLRRLEHLGRTGLSSAQRPRRWLVTSALPRTGGGKVARSLVAEGLPTYRPLRGSPQG